MTCFQVKHFDLRYFSISFRPLSLKRNCASSRDIFIFYPFRCGSTAYVAQQAWIQVWILF